MACDECGAVLDGGVGACNALSFDMMARSLDARRLVVRRTFVDAYALQHPRTKCDWPKDVARHLLELCCAIEYKGSLDIYSGMKMWIHDGLENYIEAVRKWGGCVWEAWHAHHEIVRVWIDEISGSR